MKHVHRVYHTNYLHPDGSISNLIVQRLIGPIEYVLLFILNAANYMLPINLKKSNF